MKKRIFEFICNHPFFSFYVIIFSFMFLVGGISEWIGYPEIGTKIIYIAYLVFCGLISYLLLAIYIVFFVEIPK